MVKKLRRRVLIAALVITGLAFLSVAFMIASILYGWSRTDVTVSPFLGNRPDTISRLTDGQPEPSPFSFFVVGDTRSSAEFEGSYKNVTLDLTPDFGVILGDFVAYPDMSRHRFFMEELTEWGMRFPVFLIAGNHDVVTKDETGFNRLQDPVFKEDFEKLYGPSNFSFIYRGCLFIGLNDAYRSDYLDYLKDTLARRPPDVLMIFVFMHIGPRFLSPLIHTRQMEGEEEFMRLMEAYNVDYVFAGDFHSYFRADKGHTKYIITGGGGSNLRGSIGRRFHHILIMSVDPAKDQVDEMIYSMKPADDIGDDIEITMLCGVYPVFEGRPFVWVAVFSLVLVALGVLIVCLVLRIVRPKRRSRPRA